MKRVLFLMVAMLSLTTVVMAGDKKKGAAKTQANAGEIEWLTLDEVQVRMKKEPRKVYMDIYTDWCGWCKVMDKKTFTNADVIKYINKNYYAVKFNAEQKENIRFMGKMFSFSEEQRANTLAVELMRGQLTYPTTIILEENFLNPQPVPGYLDVPTMEKILKFFTENHYKTTRFDAYEKSFTPLWAKAGAE